MSPRASTPTRCGALLLCALLLCHIAANSAAVAAEPRDLTELSLEDLLNVEVTTVSRKEERLSRTASAVYVITAEEIRRSGATSLPEVLRLAPGVHVKRLAAGQWAVSIRGFNSRFSDKLLVMIDGRSIYNSLFSGVYWEHHDVPLPDIERIEVIRGPGAALWGSNAVSGVINVITKNARETQGGLAEAGAGNLEGGFATARFGGAASKDLHYRVSAKTHDRGGILDAGDVVSDSKMHRASARLDWERTPRESLVVTTDAYGGNLLDTTQALTEEPPYMAALTEPSRLNGGHVLGRWTRSFSPNSSTSVQAYYDRSRRRAYELSGENADTVDVDVQNSWSPSENNQLLWGFGHRSYSDSLDNGPMVFLDPASRTLRLSSGFVGDEVQLLDGRLVLSGALRLEHNSFTGWETQPKASALWDLTDDHTAWFSFARAVRVPSRANRDMRAEYVAFPGADGRRNILTYLGEPDFDSEKMNAYEAGHRFRLSKNVGLDTAVFYHDYDSMVAVNIRAPFLEEESLIIPAYQVNGLAGAVYGGEVVGNWRPARRWRLTGSYSWLEAQFHATRGGISEQAIEEAEAASPRTQYQIRSYVDLPARMEVDTSWVFTGGLPLLDSPSHHSIDARWSWRLVRSLQLEVAARNLLNARQTGAAWINNGTNWNFGRTGFVKVRWSF